MKKLIMIYRYKRTKQINYAYTKNEPDEYFDDEDDEMVGRIIRI